MMTQIEALRRVYDVTGPTYCYAASRDGGRSYGWNRWSDRHKAWWGAAQGYGNKISAAQARAAEVAGMAFALMTGSDELTAIERAQRIDGTPSLRLRVMMKQQKD